MGLRFSHLGLKVRPTSKRGDEAQRAAKALTARTVQTDSGPPGAPECLAFGFWIRGFEGANTSALRCSIVARKTFNLVNYESP